MYRSYLFTLAWTTQSVVGCVLRSPFEGGSREAAGDVLQVLDSTVPHEQNYSMSPRHFQFPYRRDLRQKARVLRKNSTLGEVLLWRAIKGRRVGCEFHRQVPVGDYIVDFFCHEKALAVEIDG